jgi:AraC family transcriptional regulator
MLTNSPSTNLQSYRRFDRNSPTAFHATLLLRSDRRSRVGEGQHEHADHWLRPLVDHRAPGADARTVEIFPADAVKRRAVSWDGMTAEIVQATRPERTEYRFCGARHLLAVYEQGERREGETLIEGLPRSTLRDFKRKLVFVPAGHQYSDCRSRARSRAWCIFISIPPRCRRFPRRTLRARL